MNYLINNINREVFVSNKTIPILISSVYVIYLFNFYRPTKFMSLNKEHSKTLSPQFTSQTFEHVRYNKHLNTLIVRCPDLVIGFFLVGQGCLQCCVAWINGGVGYKGYKWCPIGIRLLMLTLSNN